MGFSGLGSRRLGGQIAVLALCWVIAAPQSTLGLESKRSGPPVCLLSDFRPGAFGPTEFNSAPCLASFPRIPNLDRLVSGTDIHTEPQLPCQSLFSEKLSALRWPGLAVCPVVDEWISHFAWGPGRPYLAKSVERSAPYIGMMEEIIREEGLPPEVLAIVYIESGFDLRAVSRKRAVGPWQFMRTTARRFGLQVGKYLDERRDPDLSTRAAVRYLKYLHGLFDSWPLATASYNSGEGRVLRAVKKQNTRDFWRLDLPRQTKEFIPKVAAVLTILGDPERYGFSLPERRSLAFDVVEVNGPVKLSAVASVCGASKATLEALNPALVRGMTPPASSAFPLRVPFGSGELCRQELSRIRFHHVAQGETLSEIADLYDVSVASIAKANAIENPHRIRQGALLTIPPVIAAATTEGAGMALTAAASRTADILHYTVRPGDSLWRISSRFGTTVAQLAKWNSLRVADKIRPGQVLKIFQSGRVAG